MKQAEGRESEISDEELTQIGECDAENRGKGRVENSSRKAMRWVLRDFRHQLFGGDTVIEDLLVRANNGELLNAEALKPLQIENDDEDEDLMKELYRLLRLAGIRHYIENKRAPAVSAGDGGVKKQCAMSGWSQPDPTLLDFYY